MSLYENDPENIADEDLEAMTPEEREAAEWLIKHHDEVNRDCCKRGWRENLEGDYNNVNINEIPEDQGLASIIPESYDYERLTIAEKYLNPFELVVFKACCVDSQMATKAAKDITITYSHGDFSRTDTINSDKIRYTLRKLRQKLPERMGNKSQ